MLPWDEEFASVYGLHLLVFLIVSIKLVYSNRKKIFAIHAIIMIAYVIVNLFLLTDESNYQGGGSLVVLFYSGISPLIHLIILLIQEFITHFLTQWNYGRDHTTI